MLWGRPAGPPPLFVLPQWAAPHNSARAVSERFFVGARYVFEGILCVFREKIPQPWRKRSADSRRRIVRCCPQNKNRPEYSRDGAARADIQDALWKRRQSWRNRSKSSAGQSAATVMGPESCRQNISIKLFPSTTRKPSVSVMAHRGAVNATKSFTSRTERR